MHFKDCFRDDELVLDCEWIGSDLLVTLLGGNQHIGAVAHASPYISNGKHSASVSVIESEGHRDGTLAVPLARKICKVTRHATWLVVGIHFDELSAEELTLLESVCYKLTDLLIGELHICD